jgi:hypothetical protein
LVNTGFYTAYQLELTGSDASSGVVVASVLPTDAGFVSAGEQATITIGKSVPMGVAHFVVRNEAAGFNSCGSSFRYYQLQPGRPEAEPGQGCNAGQRVRYSYRFSHADRKGRE